MPNVSHVAGRRRRVRAPIEKSSPLVVRAGVLLVVHLAAGARYALERAFVAGRLVRGERQEQLLQVAAGLEPSGVDAALGQGPVHLRRSGGGTRTVIQPVVQVGNLYLLLTGKPAKATDRLGHLTGSDATRTSSPVEEVGHRPSRTRRPAAMIPITSAICCTSARRWLDTNTVFPSVAR